MGDWIGFSIIDLGHDGSGFDVGPFTDQLNQVMGRFPILGPDCAEPFAKAVTRALHMGRDDYDNEDGNGIDVTAQAVTAAVSEGPVETFIGAVQVASLLLLQALALDNDEDGVVTKQDAYRHAISIVLRLGVSATAAQQRGRL